MELGALGEFIGSIAVIVTLIYLALQIRQNTSQQKREETVSIQHGQNKVVAQMQDPSIVRAFVRAADGDTPASVTDRAMAIIWIIQYLNHFQIVFDLHDEGSLDDERYNLWESFAVSMIASKGIRAWWDDEFGKLAFMPKVRSLIDKKLADAENPPIPFNKMWSIFTTEAWRDA
jgi:hypothetical protein